MKYTKKHLIILICSIFWSCIGLGIYFGVFYERNETVIKVVEETKKDLDNISVEFDMHAYVRENIKIKPGVNMKVIPEIDTALYEIIDIYRKILKDSTYMPLITSANDYNGHSKNSAHYRGAAVDIRIRDLDKTSKKNIIVTIKKTLGKGYFILHEDIGSTNEHLHIQLKRS